MSSTLRSSGNDTIGTGRPTRPDPGKDPETMPRPRERPDTELIMKDRNEYGTLPRIPTPGTLRLEIDGSLDQLRLYMIDNGDYVVLAEIGLREVGSPEKIDWTCLNWGKNVATDCGFMALGHCEITPILYVLEGPASTRDRLVLLDTGSGYLLSDPTIDPPRKMDLGPKTLEDADMVQVAAQRARDEGYRPIGYRHTFPGCWVLAEALPFPSSDSDVVKLLARDESRSRSGIEMAAILVTTFVLGASFVATVGGVWWVSWASAVVALVSLLVIRSGRRTWHSWSCEICQGNGLMFTARFRSAREARKAREEHMCISHGQS